MIESAFKVDPIVVGIVKDLDDPKKLGRVRVELPHLGGQKTDWARLATMMAGADSGSLFRPEPEDEVLVAFLHGDSAQPYVIGCLWNEQDRPPENGGAKENHLRTLRSRSGHIIRFNDEDGSEKIEIITSSEKQRVVIDVAGLKISIEADEGDIDVKASDGKVTVEAGGDIDIKAGGNVTMKGSDITVEASGTLTLKGSTVKIN